MQRLMATSDRKNAFKRVNHCQPSSSESKQRRKCVNKKRGDSLQMCADQLKSWTPLKQVKWRLI